MVRRSVIWFCFSMMVTVACRDCGAQDTQPFAGDAHLIALPPVSQDGIFDPSLADTGPDSRIWMSYTAVDPSPHFPDVETRAEATRLAYSDNHGATWRDLGVKVNDVLDFQNGTTKETWVNEVSSLVYDASAEPDARWQLYWHHYLSVRDSGQFQNGWIGYKGASTPEGLASAREVKLFAGRAYNKDNDSAGATGSPVSGAPVVQLDALSRDLGYCVAFTEPAALATSSGLYMAMTCLEPKVHNPIGLIGMGMLGTESTNILLKCDAPCHPANAGAWKYVGTLLAANDAGAFGYKGFSAPDLFIQGNQAYMLISPQSDTPGHDAYNGCWLMYFSNLEQAALARTADGKPIVLKRIEGSPKSFNGACTYRPSASAVGFLYGEIKFRPKPLFQIFQTGPVAQ